jgi:hypothetical protein
VIRQRREHFHVRSRDDVEQYVARCAGSSGGNECQPPRPAAAEPDNAAREKPAADDTGQRVRARLVMKQVDVPSLERAEDVDVGAERAKYASGRHAAPEALVGVQRRERASERCVRDGIQGYVSPV